MSGEGNSKLTEPRVSAVLNGLEHGMTRRAAAGAGGIHPDTFYEWMRRDPTFSDAVEKAEAKAEAAYTMAVAAAVPKSWQAAAWWLERRKNDDYGRKDQVEMKIDVRAEVRRMAAELGLDEDAALAEVERMLGATQ